MISVIFIICVLFSCINNKVIIEGCREGLLAWYDSALPVILPFLLLTSLYTSYLSSKNISQKRSIVIMLITGLFCGFPTGALTCCNLLGNHQTDKKTVYALMPLCNNISPMFLFGYIYPIISPLGVNLPHMLICLYVPELLFCLAYLMIHQKTDERSKETQKARHNIKHKTAHHKKSETAAPFNRENEAAATISHIQKNETATYRKEPDDPLMSSIKAITMIGIYIIIFSILSNIIAYISHDNSYVNLALPMLEITKGSLLLGGLEIADKIKTALIIFLTSFGGVCAILQAGHFLRKSGLSLLFYTTSKITCAIASVALHLLLTMI